MANRLTPREAGASLGRLESARTGLFPLAVALMAFLAGTALGQEGLPEDLTTLSLQDLLKVRVTSVAKVPQSLSRSPAAIFVILQDDLRRSGATCIPEALRLVPGVQVARIDGNKWAISIRGAGSRFFNKLLVLIDGRSVYDPLHAGVYWDVQDTLLEDVDRIEVIRGPGATLWGANAVTGVINVITKPAHETQGGLISAGGGNETRALGALRYGAQLGDDASYRIWGRYSDWDDLVRASGRPGEDERQMTRGGFRVDWARSAQDSVTFTGDLYDGTASNLASVASPAAPSPRIDSSDIPASGNNLRMRWQRTLSASSDWALQLYYDTSDRTEASFREARQTYDLDFQRHDRLDETHDLLWGLGYRMASDQLRNAPFITITPASRDNSTVSAFVQDRIALRPQRLELTLGSRFEHNDFTGFELQPTARLLWTPCESQTWWAAVSRAVRTPSRLENDLDTLTLGPTSLARVTGRELIDSEKLLAYELGYRTQASRKVSIDVAAFYERFLDLVGSRVGTPGIGAGPFGPVLVVPFRVSHHERGTARGFELFTNLDVSDRWKLGLGFSSLDLQLSTAGRGNSPNHQAQLRSYLELSADLELNTSLAFVERLRDQGVPSYFRLDAQLAWHATPGLDLSLVGQNLLDDRHAEFGVPSNRLSRPEVERGVYAKATWHF